MRRTIEIARIAIAIPFGTLGAVLNALGDYLMGLADWIAGF